MNKKKRNNIKMKKIIKDKLYLYIIDNEYYLKFKITKFKNGHKYTFYKIKRVVFFKYIMTLLKKLSRESTGKKVDSIYKDKK